MKARLANIVAVSLGLLLAGSPALAQQTENTATPTSNVLVGDPQLRNFSLEGNVTRPAPAPTAQAPAQQHRTPTRPATSTPTPTAPRTAAPDESSRRTAQATTPPLQAATPTPRVDLPELPPQDSLADQTALPQDTFAPPPAQSPAPPAAASSMSLPALLSIIPWIIAALALGGAIAWFMLRPRPRESYGTAGTIDLFDAPAPDPQPAVAPPPPTPQPVPAQPRVQAPPSPTPAAPTAPSSGIVSTSLRPWLELEFNPDRAVVDDKKAAVAFELSVYNSGSMPARDVLLEASLFNAGPMQDEQIKLFFDNPVGKADPIPVIAPMKRITVNTAVFLAKDQLRPIELEGRTFFVPMVAFNAIYSWGANRGQTSTSYLVGKETKGEKLAPFRLDLGPRIFRGLGARQHELLLRK